MMIKLTLKSYLLTLIWQNLIFDLDLAEVPTSDSSRCCVLPFSENSSPGFEAREFSDRSQLQTLGWQGQLMFFLKVSLLRYQSLHFTTFSLVLNLLIVVTFPSDIVRVIFSFIF